MLFIKFYSELHNKQASLRARDILEWEQGFSPFKSDLSLSLRFIPSCTINTLKRERENTFLFDCGRSFLVADDLAFSVVRLNQLQDLENL